MVQVAGFDTSIPTVSPPAILLRRHEHMEPQLGIEPKTTSLPRMHSTTELQRHVACTGANAFEASRSLQDSLLRHLMHQ
jgi:hypothetical protein